VTRPAPLKGLQLGWAPAQEWDIPHGFKPRILARIDASIALPDRALITQCRVSLRDHGLGALPCVLRTQTPQTWLAGINRCRDVAQPVVVPPRGYRHRRG
jgi:hypothetical protein